MSDATVQQAAGPASALPNSNGGGPYPSSALITGYEIDNNHPLTADYYGIPTIWNDSSTGFEAEVSVIENWLNELVKTNQLDNKADAGMRWIAKVEKLNNINQDAPPSVKIRQVGAYVRFLMEAARIRSDPRPYDMPEGIYRIPRSDPT